MCIFNSPSCASHGEGYSPLWIHTQTKSTLTTWHIVVAGPVTIGTPEKGKQSVIQDNTQVITEVETKGRATELNLEVLNLECIPDSQRFC